MLTSACAWMSVAASPARFRRTTTVRHRYIAVLVKYEAGRPVQSKAIDGMAPTKPRIENFGANAALRRKTQSNNLVFANLTKKNTFFRFL